MSHKSDLRVPWGVRAAYAAPAFVLAAVGVPLYVFVPKFYTDVVGVDIAVMGWLILAARLFDGISDPLVGLLSDRTRTSLGRRRPYLFFGAAALSLLIYLMYVPPSTGQVAAAWWFGTILLLLTLAWTVVDVPWEAMGPELTFDYDERTAIFGIRDGLFLFGTLAAVASPALIAQLANVPAGGAGEREKYRIFALAYAPLILFTCWWCAAVVRERAQASAGQRVGVWKGVSLLVTNRPFRILLLSYTIAAIGSNLPATLILFYLQYVLGTTAAEGFLLLYFLTGIVFLPLWVRLSRAIDKKKAWLWAMAVNTGAFFGVFFLGEGDLMAYGVLVFLSGIGFGANIVIPSSMQADVIDYDELRSGERREGQYIGIWAIAKKVSSAAGLGLALPILGAAGYQAGVEQTEQVKLVLRVLYALLPCLCNAVAICIALRYPIDAKSHAAILNSIREGRIGEKARDPLKVVNERA